MFVTSSCPMYTVHMSPMMNPLSIPRAYRKNIRSAWVNSLACVQIMTSLLKRKATSCRPKWRQERWDRVKERMDGIRKRWGEKNNQTQSDTKWKKKGSYSSVVLLAQNLCDLLFAMSKRLQQPCVSGLHQDQRHRQYVCSLNHCLMVILWRHRVPNIKE